MSKTNFEAAFALLSDIQMHDLAGIPKWDADKSLARIALALSQAYSRGLEDAARVADRRREEFCGEPEFSSEIETTRDIAFEIRALGDK